MNGMTYKGYTAKIEYSATDGCLFGELLGITDVITFEGDSVAEIRKAFEEAVDDYIDFCAKVGHAPQKPYSGKIMLRVPPEDHARLALQSKLTGKSINALVMAALHQSGTLQS
jgi:predicted HicB family RNase H-like nuclease